jgi:hypothetical protein
LQTKRRLLEIVCLNGAEGSEVGRPAVNYFEKRSIDAPNFGPICPTSVGGVSETSATRFSARWARSAKGMTLGERV